MPIAKIACCTDFSENAEAAFLAALETAEKFAARLYLLHVLPPVPNPMMASPEMIINYEPDTAMRPRALERLQEAYGGRLEGRVEHELVVLSGHVSSEILRFLEEQEIDLVVMGAFGFSGMGLVLFGSVAKRVAQKAPCSVMIVRQPPKDAASS